MPEEAGTKEAAAGLALIYSVGLLTTNAFLFSHGISDFSLLRPKAIVTGAVVVGSISAISFWPTHEASRLADNKQVNPWSLRPILGIVGRSLLSFLLLTLICYQVDHLHRHLSAADWPIGTKIHQIVTSTGPAAQLYISSTAIAILSIQIARFYRFASSKNSFSGMAQGWGKVLLWTTVLLILVAWYISAFAKYFYVVIPNQFGGGRPEEVRFQIRPRDVPIVKRLGIKFVEGTGITETLNVIHESDESVSVLVGYIFNHRQTDVGLQSSSQTTTVSISKKMIAASIVDFSGVEDALKNPDHEDSYLWDSKTARPCDCKDGNR